MIDMLTGLFIAFQRIYRPLAILLTLAAIGSVVGSYVFDFRPFASVAPLPSPQENTPQLLYRHQNPITLLPLSSDRALGGGDGIFFLDNETGLVYRLQGGEALLVSDFKIFPGQRVAEISRDGTKVIVLDERGGVDPAKVVVPTKAIDLLRKRIINLPLTVLRGTRFSEDGSSIITLMKPYGSEEGVLADMNFDGAVTRRIVAHPMLRFAALTGYFPARNKIVFTTSTGGFTRLFELSFDEGGVVSGEARELIKDVSREVLLEQDNSVAVFARTDFGTTSPKLFIYNRLNSSILFTEISGRIEHCAVASASTIYCFDESSHLWQIDLSKPFPNQVSKISVQLESGDTLRDLFADEGDLYFIKNDSSIFRYQLR